MTVTGTTPRHARGSREDRLGNTWNELDPTHLGGPVTTTAVMHAASKGALATASEQALIDA
jgi:hypothetical protein